MTTENEKLILEAIEFDAGEIDLQDLDRSLEEELEGARSDLEFLREQHEHIDNPDHLGETVLNVVWEQFVNQVAATAGADFIRENGGLTLDLRSEAHIQTTENFAEGKIATHNTKIDYQQRYDDWQNNFQRNDDGSIKTKVDRRTGEEKAVLRTENKKKDPTGQNYNTNYDARAYIDDGRPQGSKTVHKDHTISAAEIIRDAEANAHMTREEQANFANSEVNLVDLDSRANESKQDSRMTDWLDSERNGERPADRFPIDEDELRQRDKDAREEYAKQKKEAEERSIKAGKQSQKEEFFRIGKQALRSAFMAMLATLLKEIIWKLVHWLKSDDKSLNTLVEHVKSAIKSFATKLKALVVNTADSVFTTIASSIIGPVVGMIKKTITLLKQGWASLKAAIQYIRAPEHRHEPLSVLLPQVGIIVTTGLTGIGAVVLGEFIEKALMGIPFLAVEIPLFGCPANIIGILMGAIVCGIIGAIAINLINKHIAKQQDKDNRRAQMEKQEEILAIQDQLLDVRGQRLASTQTNVSQSISARHKAAGEHLTEILEEVLDPAVDETQDMNNDELKRLLQGF